MCIVTFLINKQLFPLINWFVEASDTTINNRGKLVLLRSDYWLVQSPSHADYLNQIADRAKLEPFPNPNVCRLKGENECVVCQRGGILFIAFLLSLFPLPLLLFSVWRLQGRCGSQHKSPWHLQMLHWKISCKVHRKTCCSCSRTMPTHWRGCTQRSADYSSNAQVSSSTSSNISFLCDTFRITQRISNKPNTWRWLCEDHTTQNKEKILNLSRYLVPKVTKM